MRRLARACRATAQHLGDEFDGVVVGVTKFGVFVQMTALLAEGLVHVRDRGIDQWQYDDRNYALVGSNTNKTIRLGDAVRVQIAAAPCDTATRALTPSISIKP